MITQIQKQEVHDFLHSKKIPVDVLIEMEDHFVSQIIDVQNEKNIGFNEAFIYVKDIWKDELKMKYSYWLNLHAPSFLMKIINREFFKTFRKAAAFSIFITALTIVFAKTLSNEIFAEVYLGINVVFFAIPFLVLIFFLLKDYKYFNTNRKSLQYSVYQRSGIVVFLAFFFQFGKFGEPEKYANVFSNYFSDQTTAINFYVMIFAGTFLMTYSIFGFFNLLQHQKIVSKLKNQLRKA